MCTSRSDQMISYISTPCLKNNPSENKINEKAEWLAGYCPGDVGLLPGKYSGGTFGTRGDPIVCVAALCCARITSRCRSFSRFVAAPPVNRLMPLRIMDSRECDPSVTLRGCGWGMAWWKVAPLVSCGRSSTSDVLLSSGSSSERKADSLKPIGGVACGGLEVGEERLFTGDVTERVCETGRRFWLDACGVDAPETLLLLSMRRFEGRDSARPLWKDDEEGVRARDCRRIGAVC